MTFNLRPYQVSFINSIRSSLGKSKQIIACAATGSGKSKVFISIAKSAIEKGKTVLIISESVKIFNQIADELPATQINAGVKDFYIRQGCIYIAMAQTLSRRKKMIENFAYYKDQLLIIVDEAHISVPTKLLHQLPDALRIGFTATPSAKHGKHLPVLYKDIVVGPQPHDLVNQGFLSSYRHFARKKIDSSQLQTQNGEFTEASQEFAFTTNRVYDGICDDLHQIPYKKCIIFTSSIKHCGLLTAELQSRGFNCCEVHSGLPANQSSYNLGQFMYGEVDICISVGILTKGFDYPPIDLVVIHRATMSLPLYLQMCGRGSRIAPGKTKFTVLDYGENYTRHKTWDYEHDWAELWCKVKKKDTEGAAPIKLCPSCDFICHSSAPVCPNCGHVFEKKEPDPVETELVEITQKYTTLIGRKVSELTAEELAVYAKEKNKKGHAIRVAKRKEQLQPGFLSLFANCMGYKNGWVRHQEIPQEPVEFFDTILK